MSKQVVAHHGVKQCGRNLLVPVYGGEGGIESLQYIAPNGKKWFFSGGKTKGGRFCIGNPSAQVVIIVEGYATGCSLYELLKEQYPENLLAVVAFNAGNLKPVAVSLREQYPRARLIVGADNDRYSRVNIGVLKAREAADAAGAEVYLPTFPEGIDGTDWNDLITRM